jgi:hypothetical protein
MARKAKDEGARPANGKRGEITLLLEGEEYVLRPTWEAIEAFEGLTDKGLFELARDAIAGKLRVSQAAQIATECIRAWGRATGSAAAQGVNVRRVGELLMESEGGFVAVQRTLAVMLGLAVTGEYTSSGEVKATGTLTTTTETPVAG